MVEVYESARHGGGWLKTLWPILGGVLAATLVSFLLMRLYHTRVLPASGVPVSMPLLETNRDLITANTARIGSDDPVETAVAVSQIVYPVTEEENAPGAIILINRNRMTDAMVAANRVQHFPVNAPILFVDEDTIPDLTRSEMLRLEPEGVAADFNTQVYLIGTIGDGVVEEVREMGFNTRVLRAEDPILLAEVVDSWSSTQHGNHPNAVHIANLDNPEPALPGAFWNAHRGDGFAFVTDDGIPEATHRILSRRAHGPWIYVYGDETVVPESIVRELAQYGHVTRIPRAELPEISTFFAGFHDTGEDWSAWFLQGSRSVGWDIAEAGHNAIFVNLNGPAGWQNVLAATTLSHMGKHAPAIFVDADSVPDAVVSYLETIRPYPTAPQEQLLNHGWIIGGEETISWETQVELDLLLEGRW